MTELLYSFIYKRKQNKTLKTCLCVGVFCQVWCGLSDGGVERRHRGPGLQRSSPPLHLPVGPAAVQLCGRPPVAAPHLPLPRLHEGPGGALQRLRIAPGHTDGARGGGASGSKEACLRDTSGHPSHAAVNQNHTADRQKTFFIFIFSKLHLSTLRFTSRGRRGSRKLCDIT